MSDQGSTQQTAPKPASSPQAGSGAPGAAGTKVPVPSAAGDGGAATKLGIPDNSLKFAALRVGWMMAEARGNLLSIRESHGETPEEIPWLPLDAAGERSKSEHTVEVVKVLAALAVNSGLDLKVSTLTVRAKLPESHEKTASGLFRYLAWRHLRAMGWMGLGCTMGLSPTEANDSLQLKDEETKEQLAGFLWAWDEAIQDALAAQEYGTSSCYQLGRGLAETYWALDPDDKSGPRSWGKLLGDNRTAALEGLLDRLSSTVLPAEMSGAIKDALGKWAQFAKDLSADWEKGDRVAPGAFRAFREHAKEDLGQQVKKWRDLLLMAADSRDFGDLGSIARASRSSRHIFAFYWPEIAVSAVASGALGYFLYYLIGSGKSYEALLSALSALGLTGSVAVGIVKSLSQGVTNRVHAASNLDAVKLAFTIAPPSIPKR